MSDNQTQPVRGVIAEYANPPALLAACRRVRDAGYKRIDAYSSFPIHGIDEALGIKATGLPWIVLAGGLIGASIGLAMQLWMNGIDYKYIISGKPYFSVPAFIPVAFELTILLASFGAFFGMLALNGLPRFSNALFTSPRFDRATDDRFFLMIDARDERFEQDGASRLLAETGSTAVETVVEDDSPTHIPPPILHAVVLLGIIALVPLLIVGQMRVTESRLPRFHVFLDMDFQPNKDPQTTTTLFADGRTMRPPVPGTVARGELEYDSDFYTGIDMERLAARDPQRAARLVAAVNAPLPQAEPAGQAGDGAEAPAQAGGQPEDTTPWLESIPMPVDRELVERGQKRFNIYCAVCHGVDGAGNGLVNERARELLATDWVQPSSLHQDYLYAMPDGQIYNTITNGVRKMAGYGSQIPARDRWAIVAYVRALQRSRNADLADVPADQQDALQARQAEIEAELAERAAQAAQQAAEQAQQASEQAEPGAQAAQPATSGAEPAEQQNAAAAAEPTQATEAADQPAAATAPPAEPAEAAEPSPEAGEPTSEAGEPTSEAGEPTTGAAEPAAEPIAEPAEPSEQPNEAGAQS